MEVGECEANVNQQAANAIEDAKPRSTAYLISRNSNYFEPVRPFHFAVGSRTPAGNQLCTLSIPL
jgi:hypothetical protein